MAARIQRNPSWKIVNLFSRVYTFKCQCARYTRARYFLFEDCLPCGFHFTCLCTNFPPVSFSNSAAMEIYAKNHAIERENEPAAEAKEKKRKKKCVPMRRTETNRRLRNIGFHRVRIASSDCFRAFCHIFAESTMRSSRDIISATRTNSQQST